MIFKPVYHKGSSRINCKGEGALFSQPPYPSIRIFIDPPTTRVFEKRSNSTTHKLEKNQLTLALSIAMPATQSFDFRGVNIKNVICGCKLSVLWLKHLFYKTATTFLFTDHTQGDNQKKCLEKIHCLLGCLTGRWGSSVRRI